MRMEDIISFRSEAGPICTTWKVGVYEAHGVLIWEGKTPLLRLTLEGAGAPAGNSDPSHPIFAETKPPRQPTISGRYPKYGTITLSNCCQTLWDVNVDLKNETYICILTLLPTQVWIGTPQNEFDEGCYCLKLQDSRLAGLFGSPGMRQHSLYGDDLKATFDALDRPSCVWTYHEGGLSSFALSDTNLNIKVGGSVRSGASARTGYSAQSCTSITVSSEQPASFELLWKTKSDLEQIISVFSLESFSFEFVEFSNFNKSASLVWYLGEERSLFQPPMRHQVLVDFRAPDVFEKVCNAWMRPSDEITLSRWLFCKALRESDDGLARFVTVAQALEVLGRKKGPSPTISKCDFRKAVDAIANSIADFDKSFVDRVVGLVSSSNNSSFRHMLEHMIGQSASALGDPFKEDDVKAFCKLISDTRNALVHMTTTHKSKLEAAFSVVNKLSLRVTFWYAVILAHDLGLLIPDYKRFLFNNRVARHGLPNDVLERSSSFNNAARP